MNIEIKSGETELTLNKNRIIEVLETADGLAFNLKDGLTLIYTNQFMPLTPKQLIKGTIDACNTDGATIMVNLNNPARPVSINVNTVAPPSKENK